MNTLDYAPHEILIDDIDVVTDCPEYRTHPYRYRILAVHRKTNEEIDIILTVNSDRFTDVLRCFKHRYPGYSIEESWELD